MKIKIVMITITEKCNLDCIYCYEDYKSNKVIDKELALSIIDRELSIDDGYDTVEIDFHGGEPFLCFDLIKDICEIVWEREYTKKYYFFATTNGSVIKNQEKEWLYNNRHRFICSISLDGNKTMQDINRSNSFDNIDYRFFVETWPKQDIKMTISDKSLPYLADGIKFLHENGFVISENFAYGIDWSSNDYLDVLKRELSKLIEFYLEHPHIQRCKLLSMPIEYMSLDNSNNVMCGIGSGMKVYDTEGDLYPCHFFQPNSVGIEKSIESKKIDFSNKQMFVDKECKGCNISNVCPTCYGANYSSTGNIATRDKTMCDLNKIAVKATAYLYYRLIEKYGIDILKCSKEEKKAILIAIEKINK